MVGYCLGLSYYMKQIVCHSVTGPIDKPRGDGRSAIATGLSVVA